MLLGRFAYVVPVMAIAGSLAAKKKVAGLGGHLPDPWAAVRRPADRRDPDPRRPAISSRRSRSGPIVEHFADARRQDLLIGVSIHVHESQAAAALFDPAILAAAALDAFRKLDPRQLMRNPVIFVTEVVSRAGDRVFLRDLSPQRARLASPARSRPGSGSRCCSPISPKRSPKGAARRRPDALRETRTDTRAKRYVDPDNLGGICRRRDRARSAASATSSWSRPATSFPATARSSKASPRSTNARSPANPPRSSAKPAATARP